MVSVTMVSDLERGVPKSVSSTSDMGFRPLFRGLEPGGPEILREVLERAHHGVGRKAAECAERAEFHGVAEVFDQRDIVRDALTPEDLADGLGAAGRADPARRALAAGFDGAEL